MRTVAAGEIEQAVVGQLRALFRAPEMVAETWRRVQELSAEDEALNIPRPTEKQVADALGKVDGIWENLYPGEQERLIQLMVERLDVSENGIDLRLRADGLTGVVRSVWNQEIDAE